MTEQTRNATLSVQETAEELGICAKTVYELVHTKGFPAFRVGRRIRISREGLQEWIREQATEALR